MAHNTLYRLNLQAPSGDKYTLNFIEQDKVLQARDLFHRAGWEADFVWHGYQIERNMDLVARLIERESGNNLQAYKHREQIVTK